MYYSITRLFSHPKLKGKKTTPAPGFVLTDDTDDEATAGQAIVETTDEVEAIEEIEEDSTLVETDEF